MHTPSQPGIPRFLQDGVLYEEYHPDDAFRDQVYCFWQLRTQYQLAADCHYLILPDACIDLIFDVSGHTDGAALVMTPGLQAIELNLGRSFSYTGIRFHPGVWRQSQHIVARSQMYASLGVMDMAALTRKLTEDTHAEQQQTHLQDLVKHLTEHKVINATAWMLQLLAQPDPPKSVDELVQKSGYSRRQLQRLFPDKTGFSAHDFLKILRFHQALAGQGMNGYTDQSHYIREFKRITGITPVAFRGLYR